MDLINKIELFPFMDAFFCDTITYNRMTDKCKMDHYFMIMRTLSIAMPVYCHKLNKIQSVHILDAIQKNVGNQPRKPQWVFTSAKGIKGAEEAKNPLKDYDEELLHNYCDLNGFERKDLETVIHFGGEPILKDIKIYYNDVISIEGKPKTHKRDTKTKRAPAKAPKKK